jgi:hypothetical protein
MSLNLTKKEYYTNSYETNWYYLSNMTELQMKALGEMKWYDNYIDTGLWRIPYAIVSPKIKAERPFKAFIYFLNDEIMGL